VLSDDGSIIAEEKHWRGPGHFRICKANSYHRIELEPEVTAWTLFMPGPQRRDWGFNVDNQWIQHDVYLENRYKESQIAKNNLKVQ
jgi:hypothetical protein